MDETAVYPYLVGPGMGIPASTCVILVLSDPADPIAVNGPAEIGNHGTLFDAPRDTGFYWKA